MIMKNEKLKVLFFVGIFPAISESWLVEQAIDLIDKGVEIKIVSFKRGPKGHVSEKIERYGLIRNAIYLNFPTNKVKRCFLAVPLLFRILFFKPTVLLRVFNFKKYGKPSASLENLFLAAPLVGVVDEYDVIHCHFGMTANRFLKIKDLLNIKHKFLTTFYGQDSSRYINAKGPLIYNRLKTESSYFLVMTNEMKDRLAALGFLEQKLLVHYTGVSVNNYNFQPRSYDGNREFRIVSVGRFVPKKGFDDLLRATALISKSYKNFKVHIIGGGEEGNNLLKLAQELGVSAFVEFKGIMPHSETLKFFEKNDIIVQLSKTAPDGDTDDLPFVLLEGQISGLPAITTDHVGIPEGILDGKTGFLVPEGDYAAAAEKIQFLMQNPNKLKEFSENAHHFIREKFDLDSLNDRLIYLYRSLI